MSGLQTVTLSIAAVMNGEHFKTGVRDGITREPWPRKYEESAALEQYAYEWGRQFGRALGEGAFAFYDPDGVARGAAERKLLELLKNQTILG